MFSKSKKAEKSKSVKIGRRWNFTTSRPLVKFSQKVFQKTYFCFVFQVEKCPNNLKRPKFDQNEKCQHISTFWVFQNRKRPEKSKMVKIGPKRKFVTYPSHSSNFGSGIAQLVQRWLLTAATVNGHGRGFDPRLSHWLSAAFPQCS